MLHLNLSRRVILPAVAVLAIGMSACADSPESTLGKLCPGMSREQAKELLEPDSTRFVTLAKAHSAGELQSNYNLLRKTLLRGTADDFVARRERLNPIMLRLGEVLAGHWHRGGVLRDARFWETLPLELSAQAIRLNSRVNSFEKDSGFGGNDRLSLIESTLDTLRTLGMGLEIVVAGSHRGYTLANLGRKEEAALAFREALQDSRYFQIDVMTCQLLGVLGSIHRGADRADSMAVYYDEGIALAHEIGATPQMTRLHTRYAGHYVETGRFAAAREHLDRGLAEAIHHNDAMAELSALTTAIRISTEIAAWDEVRRQEERGRHLLAGLSDRDHDDVAMRRYELDLDVSRAQRLAAQGAHREADRLYERLLETTRAFPRVDVLGQLLLQRSGALLKATRYDDALEITDRAIAHAIENGLDTNLPTLHANRVSILVSLGRYSDARESFSRFQTLIPEGTPWPRDLVPLHGEIARLQAARGDTAAAIRALEEGIELLVESMRGMDPGVPAYLYLKNMHPFRDRLREVAARNPEESYAVEMWWRRLSRTFGTRSSPDVPRAAFSGNGSRTPQPADLAPALPTRVEVIRQLPELYGDASVGVHLLYRVCGEQVMRWTRTPRAVVLDTLAVSTDDLASLIQRSLAELSRDPGGSDAAVPRPLEDDLRNLALALLPTPVRQDPAPECVDITTDGFLGEIPFEVLNLEPRSGYRPLLEDVTVRYLRSLDLADGRPLRKGLVVAGPRGRDLERAVLAPLPGGTMEANRVLASFPGSRLLTLSDVTRDNLLAGIPGADFLYIAAHFVRDPESPYLTYLPLANRQDATSSPYLEPMDVRRMDLSACGLVVLSGCYSGSPYPLTQYSAPSFGDYFLDAGAQAVIQTLWRVEDQSAAELMRIFLEEWSIKGKSPLEALTAARRRAMVGPRGTIRHPFTWASYIHGSRGVLAASTD